MQPYCDSPLDVENVAERVYMQIITGARKYVYISTPYLIVDDLMLSALTLAAKSGVDVRILTPENWDKRLVHITTRSYYRELIDGGVKDLRVHRRLQPRQDVRRRRRRGHRGHGEHGLPQPLPAL